MSEQNKIVIDAIKNVLESLKLLDNDNANLFSMERDIDLLTFALSKLEQKYNNMIPVVALTDDAGHWYVIPANKAEEFSELLEECQSIAESEGDVHELENLFISKFSHYKTGGDLNLIQLYAATGDAYGESLMPAVPTGESKPANPFDCTSNPAPMLPHVSDDEIKTKGVTAICRMLEGINISAVEKVCVSNLLMQITAPKKPGALEMVEEFHQAFNCPVLKTPAIPDMMGFQHKNFISELETILEKMKALNDRSRVALRAKLMLEEFIELYTALYKGDLVKALDGLSDLLYVTYGTHHEIGTAPIAKEAFAEVHRSNMSKLNGDGTPIIRNDGKVLKGPNFTPPDLDKIFLKAVYDDLKKSKSVQAANKVFVDPDVPEGTAGIVQDGKITGVIYDDLKKEPPIHPDVKKVMDEVRAKIGDDTPVMKAVDEFKKNPPNLNIDENY